MNLAMWRPTAFPAVMVDGRSQILKFARPPLRIAASTGRERPASLTLGNRVEPVLVALPVRAATPSAAFAMVEGDPYMRKRVRETASSSIYRVEQPRVE